MARFFFDLQYDDALYDDSEGTELADADAAGIEAVQALAEIARDVLPGSRGKHLRMLVRDVRGKQLFELDLVFSFIAAGRDN